MCYHEPWQVGMRLFVVLLLLSILGCETNPKSEFGNEVSGKVFYRGKPLAEGTVTLIPVSGQAARGAQIQEDGSYHISDVPPGEMKITVKTGPLGRVPETTWKKTQERLKASGKEFTKEEIHKLPSHMKRAVLEMTAPGKYMRLPSWYGDSKKTRLRYTVIEGKQEHEIQLK